jgi:hypothetical protein
MFSDTGHIYRMTPVPFTVEELGPPGPDSGDRPAANGGMVHVSTVPGEEVAHIAPGPVLA